MQSSIEQESHSIEVLLRIWCSNLTTDGHGSTRIRIRFQVMSHDGTGAAPYASCRNTVFDPRPSVVLFTLMTTATTQFSILQWAMQFLKLGYHLE